LEKLDGKSLGNMASKIVKSKLKFSISQYLRNRKNYILIILVLPKKKHYGEEASEDEDNNPENSAEESEGEAEVSEAEAEPERSDGEASDDDESYIVKKSPKKQISKQNPQPLIVANKGKVGAGKILNVVAGNKRKAKEVVQLEEVEEVGPPLKKKPATRSVKAVETTNTNQEKKKTSSEGRKAASKFYDGGCGHKFIQ